MTADNNKSKTSFWKKWANKINGKSGEMGWLFAFVLVTCVMVIAAGYFTGVLPKVWRKAPSLPSAPAAPIAAMDAS